MNELELIKSQLNDINTKRVKYQTLKEQAQKQITEIFTKYNVNSLEELKTLKDNAQLSYEKSLRDAKSYIEETNKILSQYQGII